MRQYLISEHQLLNMLAAREPHEVARLAGQVLDQLPYNPYATNNPAKPASSANSRNVPSPEALTPLQALADIESDFAELVVEHGEGCSPDEWGRMFAIVRQALTRPVDPTGYTPTIGLAETIAKLGERLEALNGQCTEARNELVNARPSSVVHLTPNGVTGELDRVRVAMLNGATTLEALGSELTGLVELCDELAAQARGGWPIGGPDSDGE